MYNITTNIPGTQYIPDTKHGESWITLHQPPTKNSKLSMIQEYDHSKGFSAWLPQKMNAAIVHTWYLWQRWIEQANTCRFRKGVCYVLFYSSLLLDNPWGLKMAWCIMAGRGRGLIRQTITASLQIKLLKEGWSKLSVFPLFVVLLLGWLFLLLHIASHNTTVFIGFGTKRQSREEHHKSHLSHVS